MKTEYTPELIRNHMSLRPPQYDALEILHNIMSLDNWADNLDGRIHNKYPIFKEFEREFPSITFALATGVGKTILMGAFIAYLYTNHNIKNFFIIAPNLTVYNKLIKDFSDSTFKKYVFKRLNVFTQKPPKVITGETYKDNNPLQGSLEQSITVNVFNIGKINAEVRGGNVPQVKRLSEYLGQSYFDYLTKLDDLVVLMDESHHYRADRGMTVINELNPMLGLELTATPQVETSKGAKKFRNVVYEYSLANAISDGFVKEPAAATRKNFDRSKYNPREIDEIKLTDGIRIHRNTKTEMEAYAENEGVRAIKPFVLVVCKDTTHSAEVMEFIKSADFYGGYYADKVIELHSNQKGGEKDENIQQLLTLEHEDSKIEIVIHVNMLKEGWDVANLYTIIPLRTAASLTLREQTIGRGLRLPYGKRTGNIAVDRVTIVAHDKFEEIITAANDESSIIKQGNIILIEDDEDLGREKEKVKPTTRVADFIEQKEKKKKFARSEERKQQIEKEIEVTKAVDEAIEEVLQETQNISVPLTKMPENSDETQKNSVHQPQSKTVQKIITTRDLGKPEVKEMIKEKARQKLEKDGQITFETVNIDGAIDYATAELIEQKVKYSIDIPDIAVVQTNSQVKIYEDFELDLSLYFSFKTPTEEIVIENLKSGETDFLKDDIPLVLPDSPLNMIVGEILSKKEDISFRLYEDLLYKLAEQSLGFIAKDKTKQETEKTVVAYKKDIARQISEQMDRHSKISPPEYEVKLLKAASPILQQEYTKFKEDDIVKFTDKIPAYEIRKKVVGGFERACHTAYKFDSVPEHEFAVVLERSKCVIKWLRPASGQFKIHWQGSQLYEPDFIVETDDSIYIVEIKAYNRTKDEEVLLKSKAAREYCHNVNTLYTGTDKKQWRHMLLMDREISRSADFGELAVNKLGLTNILRKM